PHRSRPMTTCERRPSTRTTPRVRGRRRPRAWRSERRPGRAGIGGMMPPYTRVVGRTIELLAGVLLLVVGLLVLASQPLIDWLTGVPIGDEVLRWWPVLIIGLSLFFLVPSRVGRQHRRLRAGMVIPGAILAGVGAALLYTSLTDRWGA